MTDGPTYQPPDGSVTQVLEPVTPPAPPAAPPGAPGPSGGPSRGVPVWVLIVVTLAVAALAATGAYLLGRSGESQSLGRLDAAIAAQDALKTQVADLTSQLASAQAETAKLQADAAAAGAAAGAGAGAGTQAGTTDPAPVTEFTLVKKVQHYTTNYEIVVDYVQFLTGDAAAAAATAHGDESPPPNDYYVVNDNKKLRTFTVTPTTVCIVLGWGGTDATAKKTLTPGQFYDIMPGGVNPQSEYSEALYKITTKGNIVTRIEQFFVP